MFSTPYVFPSLPLGLLLMYHPPHPSQGGIIVLVIFVVPTHWHLIETKQTLLISSIVPTHFWRSYFYYSLSQ